jgi:hypothetical protein
MTGVDVEDRPSPSELGEPFVLYHGSERACHEGDCTACGLEQVAAEAGES